MSNRRGKRGEKQSRTPEVVQIEEQPKEKEIVPGKEFYESQWHKLLEKEEVCQFIACLVEEVVDISGTIIQHNDTLQRAYGYSVGWARDLMVETVKCYFITHDMPMTDDAWVEEAEPEKPTKESWCRGMMSLEQITEGEEGGEDGSRTATQQEAASVDTTTEQSLSSERSSAEVHIPSTPPATPVRTSYVKRANRPVANRHHQMTVMEPPTTTIIEEQVPLHNEAHSTHSLTSRTPSSPFSLAVPPTITTHTHSSSHIPPHSKRGGGREGGPNVSVQHSNRKMPSKSTKPRVKVSSTSTYTNKPTTSLINKSSSLAAADHTSQPHVPHPRSTIGMECSLKGQQEDGIMRVTSNRFPQLPSLPQLVDLIDPLPGVTVRQGNRSITGQMSQQTKLRSPHKIYRPIRQNLMAAVETKGTSIERDAQHVNAT